MLKFLTWAMMIVLTSPALAGDAGPRVVASIAPLHSLAAQVMAGAGEPTLLIDAAASPHSFALKPSQVRALARADLVIWIGGALEPSLHSAIASLPPHQQVLTLIESRALQRLASRRQAAERSRPAGAGDVIDPHLWLDPDNARHIVRLIATRLQTLDPARAALYARNAALADARLRALTQTIAARLEPLRDTPFMVFHDAYQYLEYRVPLNNVGIIRSHPEQGASAQRLRRIAHDAKAANVACIFAEPQFAAASLRLFQNTTQVHYLDPLGRGLPAGPDLYQKLMERLVDTLAGCLEHTTGGNDMTR